MHIQVWGEVTIPLIILDGIWPATLKNVVLILSFFISLVLLARLLLSDVYFDLGRNILYNTGLLR